MELLLLVLLGILLLLVGGLSSTLSRQSGRLAEIQRQVNAIVVHLGIDPPAPEDVPVRVLEHLRRGKKLQAIREYREATGVGLKEAKEAIERVEAQYDAGSGGR